MDEKHNETINNADAVEANHVLMQNINMMINLLKEYKGVNKLKAYEQLGLSKATISNWKHGKQCPSYLAMVDLAEKYNSLFDPCVESWTDLRNRIIDQMQLKGEVSPYIKYERFLGDFYLYYYSDHYEDIIHCGKLRVFYNTNTHKCLCRMVIGIREPDVLESEGFSRIFSSSSDETAQAYEMFKEYKKELCYQLDKRCYYYEGSVDVSDMVLSLKLHGSEHRSDHKQEIIFCIKRIRKTIDLKTKKTKKYNGGIGLVVAHPNEQHRTMRLFRIGISRWPIDINNKSVKQILSHTYTETHRVILSDDDDKHWYDLMLLYEAGLLMSK